MYEGDPLSLGARSRGIVDEPYAARPASLQGSVEIVNGEADVMNCGATALNEPGDRGFGRVGLEQLDQRFSRLERDDTRPVPIGDSGFVQSQDIPVERQLCIYR